MIFFTDRNAETVISDMLNKLNQLSDDESASAKIGHCDLKDSNANGAVIYYRGAKTLPPYTLTGPWRKETWSTTSDYKKSLEAICDRLNGMGEKPLTETEAAHARLSMSDMRGGTAYRVLFWPRAQ